MAPKWEYLPKVLRRDQLVIRDEYLEPCEACGSHMENHLWVLVDVEGIPIFCNIRHAMDKASAS